MVILAEFNKNTTKSKQGFLLARTQIVPNGLEKEPPNRTMLGGCVQRWADLSSYCGLQVGLAVLLAAYSLGAVKIASFDAGKPG